MRSPTPVGKRRTRQHIIADLGVNHVERIALRAGFSVERLVHDYGVDMLITTYSHEGLVEPGYLCVQVKATDNLSRLPDGTVPFAADARDIRLWLTEYHPVLLVLYDAQRDRGHWLDIQAYLAKFRPGGVPPIAAFRTVRFPRRCTLNRAAMLDFAESKRKLYAATRRVPYGQ